MLDNKALFLACLAKILLCPVKTKAVCAPAIITKCIAENPPSHACIEALNNCVNKKDFNECIDTATKESC